MPHIVFFNLALVWIMLWIEARALLASTTPSAAASGCWNPTSSSPWSPKARTLLDGEWRRLVCEDLILPSFKISKLEAVGRRPEAQLCLHLRHHHAGLDARRSSSTPSEPIASVGQSFYRSLAVHELPSWFACIVYFGTIVIVTALMIYVSRKSSEEVSEFGSSNSSLWRWLDGRESARTFDVPVEETATPAKYPRPMGANQWPAYGGGGANQNFYSPLTKITPRNVRTLKHAWTYRYGAGDGEMRR